jgi:hypothetical protein
MCNVHLDAARSRFVNGDGTSRSASLRRQLSLPEGIPDVALRIYTYASHAHAHAYANPAELSERVHARNARTYRPFTHVARWLHLSRLRVAETDSHVFLRTLRFLSCPVQLKERFVRILEIAEKSDRRIMISANHVVGFLDNRDHQIGSKSSKSDVFLREGLADTWIITYCIFILSIATAFLGYVLPWAQISYWGATVITNLTTAIPYIGIIIIEWIRGRYSINNATLNRFFSLHFILPFIASAFLKH